MVNNINLLKSDFEFSYNKAIDNVIKRCIRLGEAEESYNDGFGKTRIIISAKWVDYPDRKHKVVKVNIFNFAEEKAIYGIYIKETITTKSKFMGMKT